MLKGKVKAFSEQKGFGFIGCDGNDYFVHYQHILGEGHRTLLVGDSVEFMPNKRQKGLWASCVRLLIDNSRNVD